MNVVQMNTRMPEELKRVFVRAGKERRALSE